MTSDAAVNTKMISLAGTDLWQWWQQARQQAQSAGVDPAEADWLLQACTDVDSLALRLGSWVHQPQRCRFTLAELQEKWRQRLEARVPVQYLVGFTQWRDFTLAVSPAVLIPRPETELLIDIVLDWLSRQPLSRELSSSHWVDLGTGSGAIALGLAQALPKASVHGVDLSGDALAIARTNAERHNLSHRITFHQGSWLQPLAHLRGTIAGIVSNPPYIPKAVIATLEPEVANHEPLSALEGGSDGLASICVLVDMAPDYLISGGLWLVETMQGQGQQVSNLLQSQGSYGHIQVIPDLAGIDRFVLAVRR